MSKMVEFCRPELNKISILSNWDGTEGLGVSYAHWEPTGYTDLMRCPPTRGSLSGSGRPPRPGAVPVCLGRGVPPCAGLLGAALGFRWLRWFGGRARLRCCRTRRYPVGVCVSGGRSSPVGLARSRIRMPPGRLSISIRSAYGSAGKRSEQTHCRIARINSLYVQVVPTNSRTPCNAM